MKPIKKGLIIAPYWFMGEYLGCIHRWLAGFKSFGLHADVDFRISVGRLQTDMPQPSAYDVYFNSGFK